jgi:AraC-like DNA-binding protein
MSRALAVVHGYFGRAIVYKLNRPLNVHAHREGHLIFQVGGAPAHVMVSDETHCLGAENGVGINPWEPHSFMPTDFDDGALFFTLYVDPDWFAPAGASAQRLRFGRTRIRRTAPLESQVRQVAAMVSSASSLTGLDRELRHLIEACYEESWSQTASRDGHTHSVVTDYRVRRSIKLMSETLGSEIALDAIARESGLSRPHFYKLFRTQTGVTPNLYLNTLIMEKALDALVASEAPIADIGFDLGFSSQSGFARFFAANVGMAPTDYRRAAKVLRAKSAPSGCVRISEGEGSFRAPQGRP